MIHIPLQLHPDDRARYLEVRDAKAAYEDSRPRPELSMPVIRIKGGRRIAQSRTIGGVTIMGALALGGGDAV